MPIGDFRPVHSRRRLGFFRQRLVDAFHRLYYKSWKRGRHGVSPTTLSVHWFGHQMIKCPLDLWTYQEILVERRPDIVIETGTFRGGSALYLASILDMLGHGRVLTIDSAEYGPCPQHPRIRYLRGSSITPEIVAEIRREIRPGARCIVILDSDHSESHVASELRLYRDFVSVGDYLIVEDTNVNGHPVFPKHGPGPMEAVRGFLAEDDRFVPDLARERFLLTMNPNGYLKRIR